MPLPSRLAPPPFRRRHDAALLRIVDTIRTVLDPDSLELELHLLPEDRCYRRRFVRNQVTAATPARKARVRPREASALAIPFRIPDLLDGTLTLVRQRRRPWTGAETMRFQLLMPLVVELLETAARLEMQEGALGRMLAAADGAETPILLLDADGTLRYANPAAQALLSNPHDGEPSVLSEDGRPGPLLSHLVRLASGCEAAKRRVALTNGRFFETRIFNVAPPAEENDETITVVTLREHAVLTIEDIRPHLCERGVSDREVDVVDAVLHGLRNAEIAAELFITEWTVKDHMKHIFRKLGVSSRGGLLRALYLAPCDSAAASAPPRRKTPRPQPLGSSVKPDLKM